MSRSAMPAAFSASISSRMRSELAASAAPALRPFVVIPSENSASSGTVLTRPTPVTAIPSRASSPALSAASGRPIPDSAAIASTTSTAMTILSVFICSLRRGATARHNRRVRYQFVDCRFELGNPGRGRELYLAGHVPGASFLDVDKDLAAPPGPGGRHPLPAAEDFARAAS